MNLVTIVILAGCSVCILFSVILLVYLLKNEISYLRQKAKYGKVEGKVIDKVKELSVRTGPTLPFNHFLVLEKEECGEKKVCKVYVTDIQYDKIEVGDTVVKNGMQIEKVV